MIEGDAPSRRPVDEVLDDLARVLSQIDAATQRSFALIRELDGLDVWGTTGCTSTAQAVSWRTGLSPQAAREHVRVARSLGELPKIDAAFARGELSYSKVRAMTRAATAENEETLLGFARVSTAAQLEKICRVSARVMRERKKGKPVCTEQDRWLHCHTTDSGMLRIEMQVLPDEGALILNAIDEARNRAVEREQEAARRASAEAPADGDSSDGSASAEAREAPVPPRPGRVEGLLELAEAHLGGGADPMAMPRAAGERYEVLVALSPSVLGDGSYQPALSDGTPLHRETLERICCDAGIVPAIVDGEGKPLDVGRRTRSIPASIKRALALRDGGCCTFPGCTNRAWLEGHHLESWLSGGETKLDNLCLLCTKHHRLMHEGGFSVAMEDGNVVFRRPDGVVIDRSPERPEQGDDVIENLAQESLDLGFDIDGQTGLSRWDGTKPDLDMCIDAVVGLDEDDAEEQPPSYDSSMASLEYGWVG